MLKIVRKIEKTMEIVMNGNKFIFIRDWSDYL